MSIDTETLKRHTGLPIPRFNRRASFTNWIRVYEKIMDTNDEIRKYCLLYYLAEDIQNDELLRMFPNSNYSSLKSYLNGKYK